MNPIIRRNGFLDLLLRLWRHLSQRRQRQLGLLMSLMLVSAFVEVVSLGAVFPFIGILTAPDVVLNYPFVADVMRAWGVTSSDQLVVPFTVAFAMVALMTGAIRLFLLWVSNRFAFASGADISLEIYRRTLYQRYEVHVTRNSSEVINGITNKISAVVFGVLLPMLALISSAVLFLVTTVVLVAVSPLVALTTTSCLGVSYGFIAWVSRQRLHRNSERIAYEQTQVIKALQEGLGGIRDVLLDGTQPVYCDVYRQADRSLRLAQGNNFFMAQSPRYVIEALGMVVIAFLTYSLSRHAGGLVTALPTLGALALGAQRLLPALQQSYSAWAGIAGSRMSLKHTIDLLDQPVSVEALQPSPAPLIFRDNIRFIAVRFRYSNDSPWVLDGFNLTISRGDRIGFVGSTGSGKSTALDLLMGLLVPTEGELLVDGQPITGNRLRAWQQTIAHVPQSIFLADATVAENIAFGVPRVAIDFQRVQQAARQAQIAEFIESRSEGYAAPVGERGICLSGGQRQRIGIARALYRRASVLVLDEATSALDHVTEKSVMEAIAGLDRSLTIILIAHRLSTVQRCDLVVELAQGQRVTHGTHE